MRFKTWETEGGAKRSKLDVVVDRLHLFAAQTAATGGGNGAGDFDGTIPDDSDIPF